MVSMYSRTLALTRARDCYRRLGASWSDLIRLAKPAFPITGNRQLEFEMMYRRGVLRGVILAASLVLPLTFAANVHSAIAVSKSIASGFSGTILPGATTRFRVTLSNDNTGSAVNAVAFVDNMAAADIEVVGAISNACGGTLTATPGATQFSLSGGTIPIAPGGGSLGTCDIVVAVTSTTPGVRTNTIAAGAVTGNDGSPLSNGQAAVQTITVLTLQNPTISKAFAPNTVILNDGVSQLRLTINNPNATTSLPLTTVTDSFPAGMEVASTPGASVNCTGTGASNGTFNPVAGATSVTLTGGAVGESGSCVLRVNVIGTNAGVNGSQVLTNVFVRTDVDNTLGLTPASNASANLTVNSPLRVSKSFSPDTVAAGEESTLTLTLHNDRPSGAGNAIVVTTFEDDPIGTPSGLSVTSAPSTTCAGGVVTSISGGDGIRLTGGSIPAAGSCTISVPYTATLAVAGTPQTFTNNVPAGAVGNTDGFTSRAASDQVVVEDQLTIAKSVSPSTVAPGNPFSYTLTLRNYTTAALTTVRIPDSLPAGVTAINSPAPSVSGTGCNNFSADLGTAGTPVFRLDMPAGTGASPGICTVTFRAMLAAGATPGDVLNNQIGANDVQDNDGAGPVGNPAPSNVSPVTVLNTVPIAMSISPASTSEGASTVLSITFTNNSANPVTITDLLNTLPLVGVDQLVIANPAGAATTCAGGVITAVPGTDSLRLQNGVIPARASGGSGTAGTCVLNVNVTGPAGNYTNTIPASTLQALGTVEGVPGQPLTYPIAVSAPVTFTPALTASKSFSPATVQAGGRSRVRITLGNIGVATFNEVAVVDPLPAADMTVATPPNASTTCGGAPVVTATAGANSVSLADAVIPAGGECDLVFDVVSASGAASVNTIPIGGVTAAGGVRNTVAVSASLSKSTGGIVVTKSIAPNTLSSPGEEARLTITVLNTGALPLTNISFTDEFTTTGLAGGALTGMRVAANPDPATTCPGGVVDAAANGVRFDFTGGSLTANGTAGDTCAVEVNVTTTFAGTIQNTIPANAVSTTEGITNAGPAITSLAALGRLGVQKEFIPATIAPGTRGRLLLRFLNPLALDITDLALTDTLPTGMVVPPAPNATTTCTGASVSAPTSSAVVVSGGSLPAPTPGNTTSCEVRIDILAAAPGVYENVIQPGDATGNAGGATVSNPPPLVSATLQVRNPLTLTKGFNPGTTIAGQPSTLTITLDNPNDVPLTATSLVDALPEATAVAPTANASTTCGAGVVTAPPSATAVTLAGGTIPANGSCTVTVDVISNTPGTYDNLIPAAQVTTAEGVTNEEPATGTLIVAVPPVVSKQFAPVSIAAGGVSTLTLVLVNDNAADATLTANLDDVLPAGLEIESPNGLSTDCPDPVTATAGSVLVRYPSGSVIPAGTCTIEVDVTGASEGNYDNVIAANQLRTGFGNNLQPASAQLTISPLGAISGRVFRDNDVTPDGDFSIGLDLPIQSVTLALSGTDFGADGALGGGDDVAVSRTTVTDALGNYAFLGLNAGSYSVDEPVQPTGTINGITTSGVVAGGGGGTPGTATVVGTTPSAISTIVLLRDGSGRVASSPANNFAEVAVSSISGRVFLDLNNNGIQNGSDTALTGVSIELRDGSGTLLQSVLTNASGEYLFANLAPGTYSVREAAQPAGTSNGLTIAGTVPNGGTAGTVTATAVVPSAITGIILPPGTVAALNNFAEIPNGRTISGVVFLDADNDGIRETNEPGISGQSIELTGTDTNGNAVTPRTATTGADGSYSFTALPEGTYAVRQPAQPAQTLTGPTLPGSTGGTATTPATLPSAITGITLTGVDTVSGNNDFGEVPAPRTISGRVFLDPNNDGVPDANEPGVAGQTIELTGTDVAGTPVVRTTQTLVDGSYSFTGLIAGTYTLTQPLAVPDTGNGITTAGSAGGSASAVDTLPSVITAIPLTGTNTDAIDNNFAEIPVARAISGKVYLDLDNNGLPGDGEAGIGGQTIQLTGTDTGGNAVTRTAVTGSDGTYVFDNLLPGTYTLTEPVQPTGTNNGITTAGSTGGTATAPTVVPSVITGVDLTGTNVESVDNNFGEVPGPVANLKPEISHLPAQFAEGSTTGQVRVVPVNLGGVPTAGPITLTVTLPVGMTPTQPPQSPGWSCQVSVNGAGQSVIVCTSDQVLPAGGRGSPIDLQVTVASGLAGQILTPSVTVSGGGEPDVLLGDNTAEDPIPIVAAASVEGRVWRDVDHDRTLDPGEALLTGWRVELVFEGRVVASTLTDGNGAYRFGNLSPGAGYDIRFREPRSGAVFGNAAPNERGAPFTNGVVGTNNPAGASNTGGSLGGLILTAGTNYPEQSLPVDPSGVVYDAVSRSPVPGATVVLSGPAGFDPALHLVGGAGNLSQITGDDGFYQYLLFDSAPAGTYLLTVTAPAGYLPAPSTLIEPCSGPLSVGPVPDPALVQSSALAPAQSVARHDPVACEGIVGGGSASTQYFFSLVIDPATSADLVNNHVPIDPVLQGALVVTKVTPKVNVSRGDLVPYTITVANTLNATLGNIDVRDVLPIGFRYRSDSGSVDGLPVEPRVEGRTLSWTNLSFTAAQTRVFRLVLVVGGGVGEGEYTNTAQAFNALVGQEVSNLGSAAVRVVPDPTFDCTDIIGKVFDDRNVNGYQDQSEPGIPNVRLATVRGLLVTTDAEGRFHVPCADVPGEIHGSNFLMKLDDRTLPSGYRLTTENPQAVRVTRGKMVKLNFGAAIHRVIRVEVSDEAFSPNGTELAPTWREKLLALTDELDQAPSVIRFAYRRGGEAENLIEDRFEAMNQLLRQHWKAEHRRAPLAVEFETVEVAR